jgi:uncharacterized RDD family membrane protein YckC
MAAPAPPPAHAVVAARQTPVRSAAVKGAIGAETAGFWIRLAAYLLDALILGLVTGVILVPVTLFAAMLGQRSQGAVIALSIVGWLAVLVVSLAYVIVPWARSGATLGKKMLSLKIVRDDGVEPLGYGKAVLRLIGYMVSGMILNIGFLMVAFTEGNKGLHDMIAGTRVIRVPR